MDSMKEFRPEVPARVTGLAKPERPTINQVSASDIQAFQDCPRKFYYQSVLRLGKLADRDPEVATNRGSLIHLLLEWGSTQQAEMLFARMQVPPNQAEDMLAVVERFQQSAFMQRLLASPKLQKEQAFYLKLSDDGQTPRYLKGFIDAVAWQADGSLLIVDFKTGASDKTQLDYQTQADCYALVGLSQGAECVQVLMVRPEVLVNDGEPEVFAFGYELAQQEDLRQNLLAVIGAMEQAESASVEAVAPDYCNRSCHIPVGLCEKSTLA